MLEGLEFPLSDHIVFRIAFILTLAVLTHLVVVGVRLIATRLISHDLLKHQKFRSLVSMCTSAIVFTLYFVTLGLILQEFGVSLTAYLASASVIGLAVGFGSQGIVQDVVMGVTIVTTDLIDIGDLVDIGGQTGRVQNLTMRFVVIQNAMGALVYIPNRSITSVVNYRRGYVRCLVDVTLIGSEELRLKVVELTEQNVQDFFEQFRGIFEDKPSVVGRVSTPNRSKEYLRVKFRIWPNRGQSIESLFHKELLAGLRALSDDYQDWMIAVSYEVEEKPAGLRARRR